MARLHNTSQALYQWRVNHRELDFGLHASGQVANGIDGVAIGEEQFDPSRHTADMIDPMSMGEAMFDVPHVAMVVPYRNEQMNVVLHQDPALRNLPSYLQPIREQKQKLAEDLVSSLESSKQVGDQVNLFVVGDSDVEVPRRVPATIIGETEQPEEAAQAVAGVCVRGLTFVISDFNALPIEKSMPSQFKNTVAIKVNHLLEKELPANVGRISMGGLKEVNTNKAKQLQAVNEGLRQKHEGIAVSLQDQGLAVAEVVYGSPDQPHDSKTTDAQIARAIRAMNHR